MTKEIEIEQRKPSSCRQVNFVYQQRSTVRLGMTVGILFLKNHREGDKNAKPLIGVHLVFLPACLTTVCIIFAACLWLDIVRLLLRRQWRSHQRLLWWAGGASPCGEHGWFRTECLYAEGFSHLVWSFLERESYKHDLDSGWLTYYLDASKHWSRIQNLASTYYVIGIYFSLPFTQPFQPTIELPPRCRRREREVAGASEVIRCGVQAAAWRPENSSFRVFCWGRWSAERKGAPRCCCKCRYVFYVCICLKVCI